MGYSSSDVDVFEIIYDKQRLVGTSYFEFHPKEIESPCACWLDGSIFIRDAGFDFFAECFHRSLDEFDYFSFVRFEIDPLNKLEFELQNFLNQIQTDGSRESLFRNYASIFHQDIWKSVDSDALRDPILESGEIILEFVRSAKARSGILWVLGM